MTRPALTLWLTLVLAVPAPGQAKLPTPEEAREGWVALFDGETLTWDGAGYKNGELLIPAGVEATYALGLPGVEYRVVAASGALELAVKAAGIEMKLPLTVGDAAGLLDLKNGTLTHTTHLGDNLGSSSVRPFAGPVTLRLKNPGTESVTVRGLWVRPRQSKPLFDGKSLDGWKVYSGDPKREKSTFTVTPAGELRVQSGPGDLQTEAAFDDFMLQLECKTAADDLNSGVFFRALPGEYQQGYEVQIHNGVKDNDPTKPADYGTGAIYRRQPARRVVSRDKTYFTLTLLAVGDRFQTWVDGVPVLDWTDPRPEAKNPRQGRTTAPGRLSLQGHDPTTDLLFRNIRVTPVVR